MISDAYTSPSECDSLGIGPRNLDTQKVPWLHFCSQDTDNIWKTLLPSPTIISCLPSHSNLKHSWLVFYVVTCFLSQILLHLSFLSVLLKRRSLGHSPAVYPGSSSSGSGAVPSSLLTCSLHDVNTHLLGTAHSNHNQQSSNLLPPASLPGPPYALVLKEATCTSDKLFLIPQKSTQILPTLRSLL